MGERLFYRGRFSDLGFSPADNLAGDPFISLDAVWRLTGHNDQLLPYVFEKDGYSDPSDRNGALGLVSGEPSQKSRSHLEWLRLFYLTHCSSQVYSVPCVLGTLYFINGVNKA